jgi:hypothetical protein
MELPKTIAVEPLQAPCRELEQSALDRLSYLCPSRYFRFYMLHERDSNSTCWLPEGYDV